MKKRHTLLFLSKSKIFSILFSLVFTLIFYSSAYTTTIDRWRTTTTTSTTLIITTSTTLEQCYDSDYGKNYYEQGYVKDKFGKYFDDICISNYSVIEYYCSANNYAYSITYRCPLGCASGKCVISAKTTTTTIKKKDCETLYKESNGLVFLYDMNDNGNIEGDELTNKKVLGLLKNLGHITDSELQTLFEFKERNCTYEKKSCADFILRNFNKFINKYDLDKDNIINGREIETAAIDWESKLISNEEFGFLLKSLGSGYSVGWPKAPCGNYGDLNDDGFIDSCGYDEPILYVHVSTGPILTEEQKKRADLNADGKIDCKDLGLMSFYINNHIQTFPVCNQQGKCGNGICEENEANCIDCTCGNGVCDFNEQFSYGGGDFPASACPEDKCLNPNCMSSIDPKYFCILNEDCQSCVSNGCAWCSYPKNFGICRENCSVCLSVSGVECISNLSVCQGATTTTLPSMTFTTTPITTTTTSTTILSPSDFDCLQKSDCISCTQYGCSFCNWLVNFCLGDCTLCNFFGGSCISKLQNCPGATTTTTTFMTTTTTPSTCEQECKSLGYLYGTCRGSWSSTTTTTTITITKNDTKTLTSNTFITSPNIPTTTSPPGYYTCKDSDGGIDHYNKGIVTVYKPDGSVYVSQGDFCSSDYVIEYYCKKDSGPYPGDLFCAEDNAFFCEYGCENGACNKNLKVLGRAIATTNCAQYKNCFDCTNDPDCEWCNSSNTCLDSCDEGVNCAPDSCFLYMYSCGDEDIYCDKYKNCYDCTNDSYCEWCDSSKKCLGSCSEGTNCEIGACHLYSYSCDWTTITTKPITTTPTTQQTTKTITSITTTTSASITTTTIYTGMCLSNEKSIGQNGCALGQECCCANQISTTTTTTTTATTTTTIKADYYCDSCIDCENKINSASPGEVVRLTVDILEINGSCISWENDGVNFDCQGYTIDGDDSGIDIGINIVGDSNVVINCRITDFSVGIHLYYSNKNLIVDNVLNSNKYAGLQLSYSDDNILKQNTADDNEFGILLVSSNYNLIKKNTMNSNVYHGLIITSSNKNEIVDNILNYNNYYGTYIEYSQNNSITLNQFCYNVNLDIQSSYGNLGNYGEKNICDNVSGWNDTGVIGCTYSCTQNPTTTTTTSPTTTTSTTIQVAGFTVKEVKCWKTDGSYICEMKYDNYAQEDAKVLFLFKDAETGEVVSNGISFAKKGDESGIAGSQFFCKEKDKEYKVSWKVYFASDVNLENPIIWCKSNEQIIIEC